MKNIIKIALIALFAITVQSCKFLEVEKLGRSTMVTFFKDMEGLRAAVPGAYNSVYSYYDKYMVKYPDVAGDMLRMMSLTTSTDMINQYDFTSNATQEGSAVGFMWSEIWYTMANANNILLFAPDLKQKFPHDVREIEVIRAHALFIRALTHFDLCRIYAQPYNYTPDASHLGIPVVTKTPSANDAIPRKPVKDVYAQIIADLNEAIGIFGDDAPKNNYFASRVACEAFLARVYLYMGDMTQAEKYASIVIGKTSLTPYADYVNMFNTSADGKEAIFRINGRDLGTSLNKFYMTKDPMAVPEDKLYALFDDPSDIRLALLSSAGKSVCMKYTITETGITEDQKHYDPFIFRASEMYLIRAEANCSMNHLALAEADLKILVGRATDQTPQSVQLSWATKEELDELIENERAKELCFEGHRFFDITRRGKDLVRDASTNSLVTKLTYPNDLFVLPISIREIEANKGMTQNNGY